MRRAFALALLIAPLAHPLAARTLTASDGRTIEASVLGFEGSEKVRIKRDDTGQTFTLPIDTFSETDQKALRAEAAKPAPLQEGDLSLELSRLRFDTRESKTDVPLANGETAKEMLVITEEDWGYTLTLKNQTSQTLEGLRAEYILFTKMDKVKGTKLAPVIHKKKFVLKFDPVQAADRITVKSQAVTTREAKLNGAVWSNGDDAIRDTLHGIWLRIYQGDHLVREIASPSTLIDTGKWNDAK